jgi:hypothetical protein
METPWSGKAPQWPVRGEAFPKDDEPRLAAGSTTDIYSYITITDETGEMLFG